MHVTGKCLWGEGGLWGLGGKGRTSGQDPEEMDLQASHACPPRATVGMAGAAQGAPDFLFQDGCWAQLSRWVPRSGLAGSSPGSDRNRQAGGAQAAQPRAIPPSGRAPDLPALPPYPTQLSPENGLQTHALSGSGPVSAPGFSRPGLLCVPLVLLHTLACGSQLLGPPPPQGALLSGLARLPGA